jgi:hypothetical protein
MPSRGCIRVTAAIGAAVALAASHGASAQSLMSQDLIKPGNETFILDLGAIVNQFHTKLRLDGESGRGSDIDLESDGLKKTLASFDVGGTWRFLPNHRIDFEYFSAKRSGGRQYNSEITIGDSTFPIGATVNTTAKDQFFIADYRYSFVKTDAVELAGLVGLYGGQFKFDVSASGNDNPAHVFNSTASTTVPLPIIGGTVDWYIDPRWRIGAGIAGLKAHLGDVDGSVLVATVGTDYMFTRNLGVGLRYMYSDVDVDVNKSSFDGNATWRMNSVSLYARMLF